MCALLMFFMFKNKNYYIHHHYSGRSTTASQRACTHLDRHCRAKEPIIKPGCHGVDAPGEMDALAKCLMQIQVQILC